ncbi:MAG: type III pantothenate kinase [Sulfuriferula sp.]|nr:type III pantothenate kinase [Sulfuriferula sp.]
MSLLLIDAGNTRIKWQHTDDQNQCRLGNLSHADSPQIAQHTGTVTRVVVSNVAGDTVANTIASAYSGSHIVTLTASTERCGVRNHYTRPQQLGSDRWAALIGAHALGARNSIIVSAGTAITIDTLTLGDFLGGMILPSLRLMQAALTHNTAQLTLDSGQLQPFPTNTADAIHTGALVAISSAVNTAAQQLMVQNNLAVDIWLHGGDAALLQPLLSYPVHLVDNLVLTGLAVIAHEVYS